jgi:hypothetical protein
LIGSLLSILKNILEQEYGPIGIKCLGSEQIGSNEDAKKFIHMSPINVFTPIGFHINRVRNGNDEIS